ncbi:H/ACA ribonucleoprotein complex non-core subunit NAF1 [Neolecta irregularis DAH-3]|uniref:H/ACA ribonucleoprotein complex non-core subunit NAF1 n=1 Tax=Neolecta irregularis (strain DAH-3) TaxID=1198029 RepID=A0A1U7LSW5_NEOID|nr:H/ACA ribonucleoprotein complex non-core subunit NAF1 [Neolecta irregularis DAH-3]|eukprot:OLL25766.1 H/ACA ribonucleoprotein complex non-core subunit NAF1 [Neolecta irregularis DAH-3]
MEEAPAKRPRLDTSIMTDHSANAAIADESNKNFPESDIALDTEYSHKPSSINGGIPGLFLVQRAREANERVFQIPENLDEKPVTNTPETHEIVLVDIPAKIPNDILEECNSQSRENIEDEAPVNSLTEPLYPFIFTRLSNYSSFSQDSNQQPLNTNSQDIIRGLDALDQLLTNPCAKMVYASDDLADASSDEDDNTDQTSSSEEESDSSSESDQEASPGPLVREHCLLDDDGSDDEKPKNGESNGAPKTKNEIVEIKPTSRPDIQLAEDAKLQRLGFIQQIVGDHVVVEGCVAGDYKVLDEDTPLFLESRKVIGVVCLVVAVNSETKIYDTFGRVQAPLYSIRFASVEEITELGLEVGMSIFYTLVNSKFILTRALQGIKGSDASNIHDEEVGEAEQEFSDDEAEAESKRRKKQEREAQRNVNSTVTTHQSQLPINNGPYTPLQRPSNYEDMLRSTPGRPSRPNNGQQERGRGRTRGQRNRGQGNRSHQSSRDNIYNNQQSQHQPLCNSLQNIPADFYQRPLHYSQQAPPISFTSYQYPQPSFHSLPQYQQPPMSGYSRPNQFQMQGNMHLNPAFLRSQIGMSQQIPAPPMNTGQHPNAQVQEILDRLKSAGHDQQ